MTPCDLETRVNCVDRLARIEQMLKDRIDHEQVERRRLDDILSDHEQRIFVLERWRHWVLGAAGICGALTVAFWQWLKEHLQLHV